MHFVRSFAVTVEQGPSTFYSLVPQVQIRLNEGIQPIQCTNTNYSADSNDIRLTDNPGKAVEECLYSGFYWR